MRILHLFSNFKWTGPADPAASLAAAQIAAGADVVYRASSYTKGGSIHHVSEKTREMGIEPVLDLSLGKHRSFTRDRRDVARLTDILTTEGFDVVHTHLPNDFRIAVRARSRARSRIPIVRSLYDTDPEGLDRREVSRMAEEADEVFVFSQRVAEAVIEGGVDAARVHRIDALVDLPRFDPARELPDGRSILGVPEGAFLAGIVARVQPYRRFDFLLDVAEMAASRIEGFRLVVIGRGSKLEEVGREPARARGLLDRVVSFPGFFGGDDYAAALRALDVKLFLVPGTDGTARAVREALASARPVITTRRGMLPELVRHEETGFVLDESAEAFASALARLARDRRERKEMGTRALADARARFDPAGQAERVLEVCRGRLEACRTSR